MRPAQACRRLRKSFVKPRNTLFTLYTHYSKNLMDFNRYFTNEELKTTLHEWVEKYPRLITLNELSKSQEGKPIWLITLTNQDTGPATDKPAVWLDANTHATEIAGTTTTLRIAHELLSGYGEKEQITRLLDSSTYYIVPRVNPDGAALAMADNPRYVRSGTRPYPYDEIDKGIHEKDIDGDGRLLQMRIQDPHGDWKVSTLNPRLMEKRKPDEHEGPFYRLLPEGLIEDYDGYLIKIARRVEGLDFNRNFPSNWRPESDQRGAGPYPASEPEVRALVDFMTSHPNISAGVTYHTFSGVILRPYSFQADTEMDTNDLWVYQAIGERGTDLTGYKCVSIFHDFKYHPKQIMSGAFDDWAYDHLGIFSFTIELWDIVGRAGVEDRKFIEWFRKHPHEDDVKVLEWAEEHAAEDAYVDWYAFDHPQLGQVELGGWNRMYTWRNPPHAFMGEEAGRNVPFALALGAMLPHLRIHTLAATPLGEDRYHLNLVVENTGFFSSHTSNQGKKRQVRPVRAELELPEGVELVSGKQRTKLGHLEGRSNKMAIFSFGASGTDHRARAEWVVKAPAGAKIKINILSDRAGTLREEIEL